MKLIQKYFISISAVFFLECVPHNTAFPYKIMVREEMSLW